MSHKNTCANDGNKPVGACGKCGDLLCGDCTERFKDPTFRTFQPGGLQTVLIGAVLLVGIPVFLTNYDVLSPIYEATLGYSVFLRKGLVQSSIILGFALLLGVWFKTGNTFGLTSSQSHERILCEDCFHEQRQARILYLAVVSIAGIIMLYGVYTVATDGRNPNDGPFFWELRRIAFGAAIYLLRDEITLFVQQLRQ